MSVGLLAYNAAEAITYLSDDRVWVSLGDVAASLTAIPTFELVLGFVGARSAHTTARRAVTGYFIAVSVIATLPIFARGLAGWHDHVWPIAMLIGLVPAFGFAARLVGLHLARSTGRERARMRVFVAAALFGIGGIASDLAAMAGADLPRLSFVGLVASSGMLAALVLDARILEVSRAGSVLRVAAVALLVAVLAGALFVWAGDRFGLFVFSFGVGVLLLAAVLRPLLRERDDARLRGRYLVTLGRFSQQLAHDVRNPLAAIKGAAQLVAGEVRAGRSVEPYADLLDMIVERVDRIDRLLADYRRMGRVEPELRRVDLASLARDVAGSTHWQGVEVATEIVGAPCDAHADPDLVAFALENLVRNACEASAAGSGAGEAARVVVRVRDAASAAHVEIAVIDRGPGMDVRTRERAFDEFFTTKEGGTGIGLAFVARVAESHGGSVFLESAEGQGTTVTLELPAWRENPASAAGPEFAGGSPRPHAGARE
ncbi:MAG: HAMP domain-containing sensor histidine kinase [Polyangiaceae bacterium]